MKKIPFLSFCFLLSFHIYCQDTYHNNLQSSFQSNYNLPLGNWVFFDNEDAILNGAGSYGGSYSIRESTNTDFSKLTHAIISNPGANAWDSGWSLQNQQQINKGDKILIVFSIRSIAANGKVNIFAENAANYSKEAFFTVNVSQEWTQYLIPFEVSESFSPSNLTFGFHLANQAQTLEIGGYTAINFGKNIDLASLPNKVNNDEYDGFQADAPWRASAAERIENFRKAKLNIDIKTPNGATVENVKVSIKMLRHDFAFGTAISASKIAGNNGQDEIYESKIIDLDGNGHGFNWIVFENDLKWPSWEQHWIASQPEIATATQWLRARDIDIRGHTLVWPGADNLPNDINENSTNIPYIKNRINGHLESILNYPGLKGEIAEWDVLNEITSNRSLENYFSGKQDYVSGREILSEIFKKTREIDPNTGLWLNDYVTLSTNSKPGNANYDNLKLFTQELLNAGVDLEGLGFQGHIGASPNGIPSILETLDDFYDEFGLKAKITEFDLPTSVEEELAAQYLRDFMTAIFSHESMNGFLFWSFWDGATYMNEGSNLFRLDWNQTPSGDAFVDLVFSEWWTDETLSSSTQGQIETNVFKGLHEISYELNGETVKDTINITEATNIEIIIDNVSTDIEELDLNNFLVEVYPNPVDNQLIIKKNSNRPITIRLFDMVGKKVLEQRTNETYTNLTASNFKGIYIVEITDGIKTISKKITFQ